MPDWVYFYLLIGVTVLLIAVAGLLVFGIILWIKISGLIHELGPALRKIAQSKDSQVGIGISSEESTLQSSQLIVSLGVIRENVSELSQKLELVCKSLKVETDKGDENQRKLLRGNSKLHPGANSEQSFLGALLADYNRAITNTALRSEFSERGTRIGVANSMDRRRDAASPPSYMSDSSGDFFAVPLDEFRPGIFAVLPRFDLRIEQPVLQATGLDEVFECLAYNPQAKHEVARAEKAALFHTVDRTHWQLREKGRLQLQEYK